MKNALEQITADRGGKEAKGWGCFWIPNFPTLEFLVCFDQGNLDVSLYLFHYSRKGGRTMEEKLHVVDSMTATVANFKKGGAGNISPRLKASLQWTHRWKTSSFEPNKHCKIAKKGEDFELICSVPDDSQERPWTTDVPKGYVVNPEKGVQESV